MPIALAWEKLYVGTMTLASGDGSLRTRLEEACKASVYMLRPEDFPTYELRERFEHLRGEISSPGGRVRDGLAARSDTELAYCAELFVSLYDSVVRWRPPA